MRDYAMLVNVYNPTTWRFTVDNITGTFTARTMHEACLTLKRLLGNERAAKAKLVLLQERSTI